MSYLLAKVFNRVKSNLRKYSLVVIQVFIGILLLTAFLTVYSSINNKYYSLKSKAENSLIKLNMAYQQNVNKSDKGSISPPFVYDDYNWIKENYKARVDISIMVKKDENFIVSSNGIPDISTVSILYVTDSFFDIYFTNKVAGKLSKTDSAYIGKKALVYIRNGKLSDGSVGFYKKILPSNEIILSNNDKLKLASINNLYEGSSNNLTLYVVSESGNINLDECIILPMELYPQKAEPSTAENTFVTFKFTDSEFSADIGTGILNYLYKKNGNVYDYSFDTTLSEYLRQTNSYKIYSIGLMTLSVFILIIISIGLTGIILIIINRRIREIAISLALGATMLKVFLETVLESIFVTMLGGFFGTLVSIAILKGIIRFRQFEIIIDFKILIFSFCVSIFIGILASILPMVKIKNIMPIEILRSL